VGKVTKGVDSERGLWEQWQLISELDKFVFLTNCAKYQV
jgi:hypothetical protein